MYIIFSNLKAVFFLMKVSIVQNIENDIQQSIQKTHGPLSKCSLMMYADCDWTGCAYLNTLTCIIQFVGAQPRVSWPCNCPYIHVGRYALDYYTESIHIVKFTALMFYSVLASGVVVMVVGIFLLGILIICTISLLVWYCKKSPRWDNTKQTRSPLVTANYLIKGQLRILLHCTLKMSAIFYTIISNMSYRGIQLCIPWRCTVFVLK